MEMFLAYCLFMFCAASVTPFEFKFFLPNIRPKSKTQKCVTSLPSPSTLVTHDNGLLSTTVYAAVKLPFSRTQPRKESSNVNKTCRGGCFHIV